MERPKWRSAGTERFSGISPGSRLNGAASFAMVPCPRIQRTSALRESTAGASSNWFAIHAMAELRWCASTTRGTAPKATPSISSGPGWRLRPSRTATVIVAAIRRDPDAYYRERDEWFRGQNWQRTFFDRVRGDIEYVQSVTFPRGGDEFRLERVKQELNDLQSKLAAGRYDERELDDVLAALQRVLQGQSPGAPRPGPAKRRLEPHARLSRQA
jgi:hypothetical protein